MSREEFLRDCSRLFQCKSISDSWDLFDSYLEFLFNAIKVNAKKQFKTKALAEATMVNQMMFTKTAHLKKSIEGIVFKSKDGSELKNIIDPTFIGVIIRNIFETVGMFNLIYSSPNNEEESMILYNLWVISGLEYRQRFEAVITTEQNKIKLIEEGKRIEELKEQIFKTKLFKYLDQKNQNKILTVIKKKDYKIRFLENKIDFLAWHDLTEVMGMKKEISTQVYTYFSQYAHPTNVSVFQFADMFIKGKKSFQETVNFNLKYAFIFLSIFISDTIELFPTLKDTFEELSLRDQMVIDFQNTFARGREYSINRPWEKIDDYLNQ